MILPTKHLSGKRALISIGAEVLRLLEQPKTVSRLWDEFKRNMNGKVPQASQKQQVTEGPTVTYDWFVIALDTLFMFQVIDLKHGKIRITQT